MGMRFRGRADCGARGFGGIPEAIIAMGLSGRGGRGWSASWEPGDWGGSRHGRNRRRMFESGELRLVLLKLLADQPRHGYDLIRAIEELTGGTYAPSPGVVYPTLTMLQDMGLIDEAKAEGARKAFAITSEGEAHLAEKADEVEALMARLSNLGEDHRKADSAPVRRAVGNLMAALWHRVTEDGMSEDLLHEIVAILDEAARKIERQKG